MAIVGVLAMVAMPMMQLVVKRNNESDLRVALRQIRTAIDDYKQAVVDKRIQVSVDSTGYPKSLDVLTKGVEDATSPTKKKIFFLRRIPRDPFCQCPNKAPEETWDLRSYDSDPDAPSSGEDVFDIMSTSHEVGLNGITYNEW